MGSPPYLEPVAEGTRMRVLVQPGARRDEIVGPIGDHLKVRVRAAPEKGKATDAVLALLAEALDLRVSAVECVSGLTTRKKTLLVRGMAPKEVLDRLTLAL